MMYSCDIIVSAASILVSKGWLSDLDFASISKFVSIMKRIEYHDPSLFPNSLEKD